MSVNVKIPGVNPIRFRPNNIAIDYNTRFPMIDLMVPGTRYQKGVEPIDIATDFVMGRSIFFQFEVNQTTPIVQGRLINTDDGGYSSVSFTNITPIGWVGYKKMQGLVNPVVAGNYYLTFTVGGAINETYISNPIKIVSTTQVAADKNLISIEYRNSYNRDGMIWTYSSFYYSSFFTGIYKHGAAQTENSISEEDDGVNLYNSISYPGRILKLCEIHETQVRLIEKIMGLDTLKVNGESVICRTGVEQSETEKTDLYDLTINLSLKNIDNFLNFD